MTYEIKRGVPIPQYFRQHTNPYPFKTMEVGDCFEIPIDPDGGMTWERQGLDVRFHLKRFLKEYKGFDMKITVRSFRNESGDVYKLCVWRIDIEY